MTELLVYKYLILLFSVGFTASGWASYYETLPKGVRHIRGRYIHSTVSSSFNRSKADTPYAYKIEADIQTLEQIDDPTVSDVLALFEPYPEAYSKLSLGTHKLDAEASIDVNVYAAAYGITDRVTAYAGLPIYNAQVDINYKRVKGSSQADVAAALQEIYGDNWAQTLGNIVEKVYDIDGATIQSGITNALGYDELGSWQGQGLGDIELGLMYNFYNTGDMGLLVKYGFIAPTGYVDDPDIIQDVGFGDGQWDTFIEFGGGKSLTDRITANAWTRFTYQFASEKTLRVPYSGDLSISDETASFNEKLGNKYLFGFDTEFIINDWINITPSFIYEYTEQAKYESSNSQANKWLAQNTQSNTQSFRIMTQFTSVDLFQQNKFLLPGFVNFSYQNTFRGQNAPKVDMYEIELGMYF
jgi:hypothetical protein